MKVHLWSIAALATLIDPDGVSCFSFSLPRRYGHRTSQLQLDAAAVGPDTPKRRQGWVKKVLRRGKRERTVAMRSSSILQQESPSVRELYPLPRTPFSVFSKDESPTLLVQPRSLDVTFPFVQDGASETLTGAELRRLAKNAEKAAAGTPANKLLRSRAGTLLFERLNHWSHGRHTNLNVELETEGSVLAMLKSGVFRCDAVIDVEKIIFDTIQLSKGHLEAHGMELNLLRLVRPLNQKIKRFPSAFDFVGRDVVFSEEDLMKSKSIINGLRRLVIRVLRQRGLEMDLSNVRIDSISFLENARVGVRGHTRTQFGASLPFEVRTGLEPSCRGHILRFPNLEISIGPDLGLYVPIVPEITLDLGHNAQLLDLNLDERKRVLVASAKVTITPEHTITLKKYTQSPIAYGARCSVDVGRWLTRIGRFSK